jgi:hypothetical protein
VRETNNLTPYKLECSETRHSASDGWIEQKLTSAKELRWLEDVHDDLRKKKVRGRGGKMKNKEEWRQIVQEAKAVPEL